jgi:hypothetical protein
LVLNQPAGTIYILKAYNGSSIQLGSNATWPIAVDSSDYHLYKFSITGSGTGTVTLTGFIDGTQYITATDDGSVTPILTTGKTGFDFNLVSEGFITSFQVTEP